MYQLEWSHMLISVSDFSNVAYFNLHHILYAKNWIDAEDLIFLWR